jgi:hypothetical protein
MNRDFPIENPSNSKHCILVSYETFDSSGVGEWLPEATPAVVVAPGETYYAQIKAGVRRAALQEGPKL